MMKRYWWLGWVLVGVVGMVLIRWDEACGQEKKPVQSLQVGRYQLVQGKGVVIMLLDTATGEVWYQECGSDGAPERSKDRDNWIPGVKAKK